MVGVSLNYGVLSENTSLFVGCLAVVLVLSLILFFLCRWRRWAAILAVVFTAAWVILLLPDMQYYLDTRDATPDSIVEPFYRQKEILGYVLVFIPLPFVLFGLYLRRRKPSNQAMQRTAGRFAF